MVIIPNAGNNVEKLTHPFIIDGMQNDTATLYLEKITTVTNKTKHVLTI